MERKRGGELTELSWQKELRAQTGKRCMGRMMLGPRKRMRIFIHVPVVTLLVIACTFWTRAPSIIQPIKRRLYLEISVFIIDLQHQSSNYRNNRLPKQKKIRPWKNCPPWKNYRPWKNCRLWKNCPWPCAGSFSPLALLVRRWGGNQFPDYIIFCRVLWMETFVQSTRMETHCRYGAPYTLCKYKWAKFQI